jgi:hypothetical protein
MLQIIPNSQIYTDIDQIIYTIESLKYKIKYPLHISRAEITEELDYILVGLQNSKREGYLK